MTNDRTCGKPTKKGTPCDRLRSRMVGSEVEYADGCYRHMSPAFKVEKESRRTNEEEDLASDPACWAWPVPDDLENWTYPQGEVINDRLTDEALATLMDGPEAKASAILRRWQSGRCAICGRHETLVADHDHSTGMVRGLLCRPCNTREGTYRSPNTLYGRYRERHPTEMLGLQIRYRDPSTGRYAEPEPVTPPVPPEIIDRADIPQALKRRRPR